jgi:hypothetical protein
MLTATFFFFAHLSEYYARLKTVTLSLTAREQVEPVHPGQWINSPVSYLLETTQIGKGIQNLRT